jgi:hypothetical protein
MASVTIPHEILNYPNGFLWCRLEHHDWEEVSGLNHLMMSNRQRGEHDEMFRCTSCKSERLDVIHTATGALVDKAYWNPEGYKLTRDLLNRDILRLERMRRRERHIRRSRRAA